ncbi:MAG TPA: murein biosynthesis integral membrane protein MurJ [bacterium]|nr:murein biosynthesis integral membrane protein MurJ [bacterium]
MRLARTASLIAAATVASRVLGLIREIVTAWLFGATNAKAAYVIAYYIPFFVQRLLLGGTLSIVFIPTISRYLAQRDEREARAVSGILFTLVFGIGMLMVIAGQVLAPLIIPLAAPGFAASPGLVTLAVQLTRIIFLAMLFLALSVFVTGYLQAHQEFTVPALAPLVFNVVIIGGTLLLGPAIGIQGLAISWILGTAAQFLVQLPSARRRGLRMLPLDLRHPAVGELGKLAVPAMLGLAVVEINAYVGRFFASLLPLTPGVNAVAVLDYAYEVIQAPVGIFAISIATALFPLLSWHAAADNTAELRTTTSLGLRATLFAIAPVAAIAIVMREPLIQLLFERGQFTAEATRAVAAAMAGYAIGLPAIAVYYVVTRTFYALHDMATPVRVGIFVIVLNAMLDYLLMRWLGAPGIALATAIVSTLNVGALLWILRGRLSGLEGRRLTRAAIRIGASAVLSAVAMLGILQILPESGGAAGAGLRIAIGAAGGGAVYLAACRLLSVEELRVVRELIGRRAR